MFLFQMPLGSQLRGLSLVRHCQKVRKSSRVFRYRTVRNYQNRRCKTWSHSFYLASRLAKYYSCNQICTLNSYKWQKQTVKPKKKTYSDLFASSEVLATRSRVCTQHCALPPVTPEHMSLNISPVPSEFVTKVSVS